MKLIIFLLFITFNLYSQDIDYLKSQDTIYIVLKKINTPLGITTMTKFQKFELNTFKDKAFNNYYFTSTDKQHQTIIITTDINENGLKIKRKNFLRKKIDNIVTADFIDSIGIKYFFVDLLDVRLKGKVVFIIDEKSLSKRNLILKKAFITDIGFAEM